MEESRKNLYAMEAGSPVKIQIRHLLNTSLVCYYYINQFRDCVGIRNSTKSTKSQTCDVQVAPFQNEVYVNLKSLMSLLIAVN
jgi:hypothetical protein